MKEKKIKINEKYKVLLLEEKIKIYNHEGKEIEYNVEKEDIIDREYYIVRSYFSFKIVINERDMKSFKNKTSKIIEEIKDYKFKTKNSEIINYNMSSDDVFEDKNKELNIFNFEVIKKEVESNDLFSINIKEGKILLKLGSISITNFNLDVISYIKKNPIDLSKIFFKILKKFKKQILQLNDIENFPKYINYYHFQPDKFPFIFTINYNFFTNNIQTEESENIKSKNYFYFLQKMKEKYIIKYFIFLSINL
jgi:hypothetical protein